MSQSSSASDIILTTSMEDFPNALLESYRFDRKLTHSGNACVYEVVSTRGRLRNRHLAVKKVISDRRRAASTALHQTLSHPGIVTLFSVVPAHGLDYHILELCSAGNLTDFLGSRNPPILSDKEVRQLTRDLAAALAYLEQEGVIHRNICGSNVLLTKNFQAKLSDFEHATRVGTNPIALDKKFAFATYPAPEVLRPPYMCSFAVDVWALGCLILSCLQEALPTTISRPLDSECLRMLSGHRQSFQDLVVSLLAMDTLERLTAAEILQHHGLREELFSGENSSSSKTSSRLACYSSYGFSGHPKAQSTSSAGSTVHHQKDTGSGDVLKNVTNLKLRDYILDKATGIEPPKPSSRCPSPPLVLASPDKHKVTKTAPLQPKKTGIAAAKDAIPMGTTRPVVFNTDLLEAMTHKLAGGSITVLPSSSVLVDFRESQRRNGLKGDYVLLIDSTGNTINVYSAPHLSIPSCLLDPLETYLIEDLPGVYWKQYNDTALLINSIKRKTPQITIHKSGARCVRMSNMPLPDVEVSMNSSSLSPEASRKSTKNCPVLRIRYSRQHRTLELSEHSMGIKGPEWRKECLPCDQLDAFISANISRLSTVCNQGLRMLVEFLETCERLDKPNLPDSTHRPCPSRPESPVPNDMPSSLSSIRIPAKPPKYPSRPSRKSDKENAPPSPSTTTSRRKPETKRPRAHSIEDVLPDTRRMSGVGWCVRSPGASGSPKMRYQLMFDDGTCLDVNFHSGILTLVPPNGDPIICVISAKASHPEIEKRLVFLKDFMLLYDQSDLSSTGVK